VIWLLKSTIVDLVPTHIYGSRSMMEQEDGAMVHNFSVEFFCFVPRLTSTTMVLGKKMLSQE